MRSHKYLYRTGTPGNYRYWYKMPDGSIKASEDGDPLHKKGQMEHASRLLAGKRDGKHSMSVGDIATQTGMTDTQVTHRRSNMQRTARTSGAAHGFEDHHMKEAMHEHTGAAYNRELETQHGPDIADKHNTAQTSGAPSGGVGTSSLSGGSAQTAPAASERGASQAHEGGASTPAGPRTESRRATASERARSTPERARSTPTSRRADAAAATSGGSTSVMSAPERQKLQDAGFRALRSANPILGDRSGEHVIVKKEAGRWKVKAGVGSNYHTTIDSDSLESAIEEAKRREASSASRREPAAAASTRAPPAMHVELGSRARREPSAAAAPAAAAAPTQSPEDKKKAEIKKLRAKLKREHGLELGGDAPAASSTQDSVRAATAAAAAPREDTAPAPAAVAAQTRETQRSAVREAAANDAAAGGTPMMEREVRAGNERQIRKIDGEISRQTSGRQINVMQMGPFHNAVTAAVNDGKLAADAVAQEIPNFYEPETTPPDLTASGPSGSAQEAANAERAMERLREQEAPGSEAARDLGRVDPDFAASEAATETMVSQQAAGENPYIARAVDIFNRIKEDVKPARREVVEHMLTSINNLHTRGELNEENLLAEYKSVSGRRIRGLSGVSSEFEKGTFITLGEVINNAHIDPAVERMKRGFAAKQFARMKPYLNDQFTSANPSAPPPFPTYSDLKTWSQHGTDQASNINTPDHRVQKAMPQEFYDSIAKGADGKAQMPPAWMPLHLAPAWNYIVSKSKTMGEVPYAQQGGRSLPEGRTVDPETSKITMGSQAKYQEGYLVASMRKYVQMRGGADQLVDIPEHKLSESGTTRTDIFKGEKKELSDAQLMKLAKTKIIDPVGLAHVMRSVSTSKPAKKKVKKSFTLLVNPDCQYVPGGNIGHVKEAVVIDLMKSRADRIRSEMRKRGFYA